MECLMNPAKIAVHKVKRDGVLVILQLLTKSVRQSRETTIAHSQRQILPFNIANRNKISVRLADDFALASSDARWLRIMRLALAQKVSKWLSGLTRI
jgi:hypothetical protein